MAVIKISAPVGAMSPNNPQDVVTVQRLLNGHLARSADRKQLAVNGRMSSDLVEAIKAFQAAGEVTGATPGRVEPASLTFQMLQQKPEVFGFERRARMSSAQSASQPTVEVIIFDAIMLSAGSQWGHAAIDLDGKVYSRAHTKYAVLDRDEYIKANLKIRDLVGLTLRLSTDEKAKVKANLDARVAAQKPYSLTDNSCSTNVSEVLESVGILAHDPRFQMNPFSARMVSPKELLIVVSRSDRVVKRTNYSKVKA